MINTKICIIDDNEAICDSLSFLIESFFNIKTRTFTDPLLFLKELSPSWSGCVIIDLFMPSMHGVELLYELKKINMHIPVIVITGHGTTDVGAQCIAGGADAFITKPFKTTHILDTIRAILERLSIIEKMNRENHNKV